MPDAAEVAIEGALLDRLNALVLVPAMPVSLPNIQFPPPQATPTTGYLRATFLPADSVTLGLARGSSIQHYGLLRVDVFYGLFGGELAPNRVAASVISWFKRGTQLTRSGFTVNVFKAPFRGPMSREDVWVMIPVSIPYIAFAPDPA